jgi:putative ABC transport system substrate-binding protein
MNEMFSFRALISGSDNRESKTRTERRRSIHNPKWGGIVALAVAFAMCGVKAEAQQTAKVHRIAVLSGGFPRSSPDIEALRQGLRDLGYVEGKNLVIEYRYAEANRDRYPDLLADLVRLKVDIIIGDGTGPSVAAKKATSTIPIVMTSTTDPVGNGLIASLSRPGGNVTGLTNVSGELGGNFWSCSRRSIRSSTAWRL